MIGTIPKAEVKFTDGRTEPSIEVFVYSNHCFTVVTVSGSYTYKDDGFYQYYPEYLTAEIYRDGRVIYDHTNCWLACPKISKMRLWFEPIPNWEEVVCKHV